MKPDKDEPNVTRITWSTHEPNVLRCKYVADFTTPEGAEMLRRLNSPEGVRRWLDAAAADCWQVLPARRRGAPVLEREMRNLLELTIENLHAHPQGFGVGGDPADPLAEDFRNDRFLGASGLLMLHLAAETCARMLPADQLSVAAIERELRANFELVLADWRNNPAQFGE